MIDSDQIAHHRRTLQLWEVMGREPVAPATEGTDRRKRPRFVTPDTFCQLDVMGAERRQTIKVVVRDVCVAGACLLSSRSLAVHQFVALHPPAEEQPDVEAVNGRVISCHKRSNYYRIGVRFSDGE
jgi:hypothetical protein